MENVIYRGRPIVRSGKTIYYGSMANPYVVCMNVMQEKQEGGISQASLIKCYLMKTDKNLKPMEAITKNAERPSIYDALELAAAWLREMKS